MKFEISNNKYSISNLIRKIGYRFLKEDENTKEFVLIRPLESGGYPRFHLYLRMNPGMNNIVGNLHLDQKKPVYQGARAHQADYDGKVLELEVQRIKESLEK